MALLKPREETYRGKRPAKCAAADYIGIDCSRKIRPGDSCIVVRSKTGLLKARFCSVECQEEVEVRRVESPD